MLTLTQTNLAPYGNCWQTAVACILELPAEELPDQSSIERYGEDERKRLGGNWPPVLSWLLYQNVLNRYLMLHHSLIYGEIAHWLTPALQVRAFGGLHLLEGPTVRTPESGIEHVIVGRRGEPVWDPHPSRACLTKIERWGIISPVPPGYEQNPKMLRELPCLCPSCGGLEQLQREEAA
jgi:hypothetical protein